MGRWEAIFTAYDSTEVNICQEFMYRYTVRNTKSIAPE